MFMFFPNKKLFLMLFLISGCLASARVSFAGVAVAVNGIEKPTEHRLAKEDLSVEKRLLAAESRNKDLNRVNLELRTQNANLIKERDFYIKEVSVYKQIVEKLAPQEIQTAEKRLAARDNTVTLVARGGEGLPSGSVGSALSSNLGFTPKHYLPTPEVAMKEGDGSGAKATEGRETNPERLAQDLRELEGKLELALSTIVILQKKL
jgi:hypothetical protein